MYKITMKKSDNDKYMAYGNMVVDDKFVFTGIRMIKSEMVKMINGAANEAYQTEK